MTQPIVSKETLFNAILSMDSYNRGYNRDIIITNPNGNLPAQQEIGEKIGTTEIIRQSGISASAPSTPEQIQQFNDSFYGAAYKISSNNIIIAYRGTDTGVDKPNSMDVIKGFGLGAGNGLAPQAQDALNFYKAVANQENIPLFDNTQIG